MKTPEFLVIALETFILTLKILMDYNPNPKPKKKSKIKKLNTEDLEKANNLLGNLASSLKHTFNTEKNPDKLKPKFVKKENSTKKKNDDFFLNNLIDDNVLEMLTLTVLQKKNNSILHSKFLEFFDILIQTKNIEILISMMYRINLFALFHNILDSYLEPQETLKMENRILNQNNPQKLFKKTSLSTNGSEIITGEYVSLRQKQLERDHKELLSLMKNIVSSMIVMRETSTLKKVKDFFQIDKRFLNLARRLGL